MWKMLLIILAACSLFTEIATNPALKSQSYHRHITFPTVDQYNECFVDASKEVKGKCRPLADCPVALEQWKTDKLQPQTCYFNKFEQVVCCDIGNTSVPEIVTGPPTPASTMRRSEAECNSYYVFTTSLVNALPTTPREFPYMAALGWSSNADNSMDYRCGGVLVSDKFVLTAAHCTEMGGDTPTAVRLGGVNLTDASVSDVKIKNIFVHPDYNAASNYKDIALVELDESVREKPACIWSEETVAHNEVTALGYGHTRFAGASSDQLLKVPLFVVENEACQLFYPKDGQSLETGLSSTHICAGDSKLSRDTCQGDSGGPLLQNVERDVLQAYVVGITSFGQACAGKSPSVYTRTSAYIDWIEGIVWAGP